MQVQCDNMYTCKYSVINVTVGSMLIALKLQDNRLSTWTSLSFVDATDGSASVDVMYLDLCKAFIQFHILNCYTNYIPMELVENYGIDSSPIYMTDRNLSELVTQSHVPCTVKI